MTRTIYKIQIIVIITIATLGMVMLGQIDVHKSWAQEKSIPDWIQDNARWWADGKTKDAEFIAAHQWLVNHNIIKIQNTDAHNWLIEHDLISNANASTEIDITPVLDRIDRLDDRITTIEQTLQDIKNNQSGLQNEDNGSKSDNLERSECNTINECAQLYEVGGGVPDPIEMIHTLLLTVQNLQDELQILHAQIEVSEEITTSIQEDLGEFKENSNMKIQELQQTEVDINEKLDENITKIGNLETKFNLDYMPYVKNPTPKIGK